MSRAIVFMNHHLQKNNRQEPWITIEHSGQRIYANEIRIRGESAIFTGQAAVRSHTVRAWLECEFEDIEVVK